MTQPIAVRSAEASGSSGFAVATGIDLSDCALTCAEKPLSVAQAGVKDPLSPDDRAQRLPIKRLQASTSAIVPCDIYMEHPPVLQGHVSWVNPDGSEARGPFKVFT